MTDRSVLFLDVDGVLNYERCWTELKLGPAPVAPECVARLNALCETTGAKIVLSSAWRGVRGLEDRLREAGALKHLWPGRDCRTPWLNEVTKGGIIMSRIRGDEIADWLSRHPEVERYAIVDDSEDMLPEQMPFFVRTDFSGGGLEDEHAAQLGAILATNPGDAP